MNQGYSTHLIYDPCDYSQRLTESTNPLKYRLYGGAYENCSKCVYNENSFYRPFDKEIVDAESELKNLTRAYSRCNGAKYNPMCKKSPSCTSTFDPSNPIVYDSSICPIIYNNIPKVNNPGYVLDMNSFCPNTVRLHTRF